MFTVVSNTKRDQFPDADPSGTEKRDDDAIFVSPGVAQLECAFQLSFRDYRLMPITNIADILKDEVAIPIANLQRISLRHPGLI